MRTKSRRRNGSLALAVLAGVVFLPELARAQQTGLFPLAPIRRQRVPCDQEDPAYKVYKQRYFGYHPTCWEPFPKDWGCKSKERADLAKELKERPFDPGAGLGGAPESPFLDENMGPEITPVRPAAPALPGARSPFDLEDTPGRPATPGPGAPPGTGRPAPPTNDPFNLDDTPARPGGDTPATKPATGQPQPTPPGAQNGPGLSAPADRSTQAATERDAADDEAEALENDGKLLALPNLTLPPVPDPEVPFGTPPFQPTAATASNATPDSTTTPPPAPRRGLLSGFFNSLGLNWTRR